MNNTARKNMWTELWLTEDYWAIWLGMFLLAVGFFLFVFNPPTDLQKKIHKANATMDAEVFVRCVEFFLGA